MKEIPIIPKEVLEKRFTSLERVVYDMILEENGIKKKGGKLDE
jgi:hypothetical protein